MTNNLEHVRSLVPDLEKRLAKPRRFGFRMTDEEYRKNFAMQRKCAIATNISFLFLKEAGVNPIRSELHYGHMFVALTDMNTRTLNADDIIIDPTYLQFARTDIDIAHLPNTFVGARQEMFDLLNRPEFSSNFDILYHYSERSLMSQSAQETFAKQTR